MWLPPSKYVLTVYRTKIQQKDNILFHEYHREIKLCHILNTTKRKIYKNKAEIKTKVTHLERYHTERRNMGRNFEAMERKIARKASLLVNLHKVEQLRKKKIK